MELKHAYLDELILLKSLGEGGFSSVQLAQHKGKFYAVKILHPKNADIEALRHQFGVITNLNHPNIIKFYEMRQKATHRSETGQQTQCLALISEHVDGGAIFDYIFQTKRFEVPVARAYFKMILDALEYCHTRGIAHRDLKPENIMLDQECNLKIIDFGLATFLNRGQLHTTAGTESYAPPEWFDRNYRGQDLDLFSTAVILFILVAGGPPFQKANKTNPHYKLFCDHNSKFWEVHTKNRPEGLITPAFKDLMNGMLNRNPQNRLTFEQIKAHPWYNEQTYTRPQIQQVFNQRHHAVQVYLQKQRQIRRQERLERVANNNGDRGGEQDDNQLIQSIRFPNTLPIQPLTDESDFLITQSPIALIVQLHKFLCKKEKNILTDESEEERFDVETTEESDQVRIVCNYVELGEEENLIVRLKLSKVKDGRVKIRFLREQGDDRVMAYNLINVLKRELGYLRGEATEEK